MTTIKHKFVDGTLPLLDEGLLHSGGAILVMELTARRKGYATAMIFSN